MKVAIVCPYAWDRFGGVQSHVRALAASLRRRGHEIAVLAPSASLRRTVETTDEVTIVGYAVPVPANGSVAPLAFGPLAAAGIRRALTAFRPDVLHLHEPLIPSLSLLALWNAGAPCVGTFHAAAPRSVAYRAARPILARAARRLAVRSAVSEEARGLIARYFPGDYAITPNGVDLSRYSAASPADLGATKTVLFLGRLERRKGLEVLVQAMTRLRDLGATLVVAGKGPEETSCRALAARLGVTVSFIGAPHEDLKPQIFKAADVYCAPGISGESFGIVLIEAMAAGTPVVCSDLEGFRAVAAEAAQLAAVNDAGSLAESLRAVLTDSERARGMSSAGRAVAERFDWASLAGEVEAVYARAVARGIPS